jgi:O-antigen/teichoic acid export membrane protein
MNKYLKAISTNLFFFFISTIAFLLLTPMAIRLMGEEFYGLWSVLNAVIIFSTIGTLGISSIVNKFAAEDASNGDAKSIHTILDSGFILVSIMALLTAVILVLICDLIASNLSITSLVRQQYKTAMLISIVGIFPLFLSRVPQGYLLSQLKNGVVRSLDFVGSVFPLLGTVIISIFQRNLIWMAYWYTITQFLVLFLYLFAIREHLDFRIPPNFQILKSFLGFSFFMFLESLAISLFQNFDRIIVGFVLGPSAAGVYSVGTSIGVRISQITGQITDTMIPYASLKSSLEDRATLYYTFRKLSQYISYLVAIVASLCIIWMHEILAIWVSPGYAEKYSTAFSILILAYGFLSLSRPGDQTLTGLGKVKFASLIYLLSSLTMLLGLFVLSNKFGLLGATAANCIMILLMILNLRTYQLLHNKINWHDVIVDLVLGLCIPLSAFVFKIHFSSISFKLIYSIIVIGFIIVLASSDSYAKRLLHENIGKILQNKHKI